MLKFGLFDWLEHRQAPLDEVFEERLQMIEYADELGYYAYHVAEHQGTPLSLNASPAVFLSAASQRTRNIRLAPTVFCLPWHDPFRLYNDICILDQLSKGRLDVGIGRGVSPIESTYFGIHSGDQAREMAAEALEVILLAFRSEVLNFEGKHYKYKDLELWNKPFQKPYPPLWYPTSNIESVPNVAKHGYNTSHNFAPNEVAKPFLDLYRAEWAQHRQEPDRLNAHVSAPLMTNTRHIYVADSDEQAISEATPAFAEWAGHISYLSGRFSSRPTNSLTLESRMANGTALVGSVETIRQNVQEMVDATGINYFLGVFNFGDLSLERVRRSMHLFATEVMPAVIEREPAHSL